MKDIAGLIGTLDAELQRLRGISGEFKQYNTARQRDMVDATKTNLVAEPEALEHENPFSASLEEDEKIHEEALLRAREIMKDPYDDLFSR